MWAMALMAALQSNPVPVGSAAEWFGPDAYPPAAIRAGAEGRVVAMVDVDGGGHVTGCTVTISSGSADLDAATCQIAARRMTFTAARDAAGRPIAGRYRLPVVWRLPSGGATPPGLTTTLVSVGADGAVLSCAAVTPTPLGDICAAFPVGRKLTLPDALRGKVFAVTTMIRPLAD